MIKILRKEDCCGCSACVSVCPAECISFEDDSEGFFYPRVDEARCIGCDRCVGVCPVLHPGDPRTPLRSMAVKNSDSRVRENSSSGGVFNILAVETIRRGGVVFGAAFDDSWSVVHGFTETEDGIPAFMGSKYVQSRMGESYKLAKSFLSAGREVLFTGTPCHIAGLKRYLGRAYDNLTTADVVCHGVPSPMIWKEYLASLADGEQVTGVNFRDKSSGWKNYNLTVAGKEGPVLEENLHTNLYMRGFLSNIYLRPACFECRFKSLRSGSDITLGDYWGVQFVHPEMDDDRGVSLCFANTPSGMAFAGSIDHVETDYGKALKYNHSIEAPASRPRIDRPSFFEAYHNDPSGLTELISRYVAEALKPTITERLKKVAYRIYVRIKRPARQT